MTADAGAARMTAGRASAAEPRRDEGEDEEGWTTVDRQRPKTQKGGGNGCREEKGFPARKSHPKERNKSPSKSKRGTKDGKSKEMATKESGGVLEGKAVFAQLRSYLNYLNNEAPPMYVFHTVRRLQEVAKEKIYQEYRRLQHQTNGGMDANRLLRNEWRDEVSADMRERYMGLVSYWSEDNAEHTQRLNQTMKEWILDAALQQEEIECRLQFFHFEEVTEEKEAPDATTKEQGTYKQAVNKGVRMTSGDQPTAEQIRLRELCIHPATELTQLRGRTNDENKALLMILNHEIEVPYITRFLVQSMTARELALFTDIFLEIEYPVYAHLAPG